MGKKAVRKTVSPSTVSLVLQRKEQQHEAATFAKMESLARDAIAHGMGCAFEVNRKEGRAFFKCFPAIVDTRPHGERAPLFARPPPTRDLRADGAQSDVRHQKFSSHPSKREQGAVGGRQDSVPSARMRPSPQPITPVRRAQVEASPSPNGGEPAQTPIHFKAKMKWLKERLPEVGGVITRNVIKGVLNSFDGDVVAAGEHLLTVLLDSRMVSKEECSRALTQLQDEADLPPIQE